MSKIRYCPLCERNVSAKKKFSWPIFLLLCITGIGGIFYIVWYIVKPKNICPICGGGSLQSENTQAMMKQADNRLKNQNKQELSATTNQTDLKSDPMEQIKKLQALKESGAITENEFNEKKKRLLDSI